MKMYRLASTALLLTSFAGCGGGAGGTGGSGGRGGTGGTGGSAGVGGAAGTGGSAGAGGTGGTSASTGGSVVGGTGGSGGIGGVGGSLGGTGGSAGGGGAFQCPASGWVGDLDGDGTSDCVVTAPRATSSTDLIFHKGLGGNAYEQDSVFTTIPYPRLSQPGPSYADFDGNGKNDAFFASGPTDTSNPVHWITLRRTSTGLAYVDTDAGLTAGIQGFVLADTTADINNDGKVDGLVVLHYQGLSSAYTRVVIAIGDGAGGFSRSIAVPGTDGWQSASVADVNGDGKADLATSDLVDGGVVTQTLYGDGTGSFSTAPPGTGGAGGGGAGGLGGGQGGGGGAGGGGAGASGGAGGSFACPGSGWMADFDGDGFKDCAVTAPNSSGFVDVTFHAGLAGGGYAQVQPGPGPYFTTVLYANLSNAVYGDLDGDGKTNALVAAWPTDTSQPVHWLTFGWNGALFSYRDTDAGFIAGANGSVQPITLADVTGDGKLDGMAFLHYGGLLPASAYTRIVVMIGDGAGKFSRTNQIAGTDGATLAFFDNLNADGKPDMLVQFSADGGTTSQVFFGDGTGQFSTTPP